MRDQPNLRVLDVALCGLRLLVAASRCPRRPLLSVTLERCAGRHWFFWRREGESGH